MIVCRTRHWWSSVRLTMAGRREAESWSIPITSTITSSLEMTFSRTSEDSSRRSWRSKGRTWIVALDTQRAKAAGQTFCQ